MGCVVYARPGYVSPPPPPPVAMPPPAPRFISDRQAVDAAFRIARARGLAVDQVHHATLDAEGRWHVDLRGHGDRALVVLDARDGRLLRGRFHEHGRGGGEEGWDD